VFSIIRQEFEMPRYTSPPDPARYKNAVWDIVRQIPAGQVATYGQIASLAGAPPGVDPEDYKSFGARWVGGAMAACPSDVPWQRVVNSEGKISLPEGRGGEQQRLLLENEGITFSDRGRIDLKTYRWHGPIFDLI
jgi:methylated-DNA-protein-cysteine methyltransferase-like protein